jgi:hypothetical protein
VVDQAKTNRYGVKCQTGNPKNTKKKIAPSAIKLWRYFFYRGTGAVQTFWTRQISAPPVFKIDDSKGFMLAAILPQAGQRRVVRRFRFEVKFAKLNNHRGAVSLQLPANFK